MTERDLFVDNLLIRIRFIIVIIWWTGLAQWEFKFTFSGSLTATFLGNLLPKIVKLSCQTDPTILPVLPQDRQSNCQSVLYGKTV